MEKQEIKKDKRNNFNWDLLKLSEIREKLLKKNKKPSPLYILLCVANKEIEKDIINFLDEKQLKEMAVFNAISASDNKVIDMLSIASEQKTCIIGVIEAKNCDGLIFDISDKFELDCEKNDFVCLLKPNSASLETIKFFIKNFSLKDGVKHEN